MGLGVITPDLRAAMQKMFAPQPQNPLYQTQDNQQPDPMGNAIAPGPNPAPSSAPSAPPAQNALFGNSPATSTPTPSAAKPPMSSQQFAAANPDAAKPFMQARPVGSFDRAVNPATSKPYTKEEWQQHIADNPDAADNTWSNRHTDLRRALATLFGGAAEFGGDLNHHPGQGARLFDQWNQQDLAGKQYDANQPKMQAGALNQAYQNYLQQGGEQANIAHTQAETGLIGAQATNLHAPERDKFLAEAQDRIRKGEDGQQVFNEMAVRAPNAFVTRNELLDSIKSAHSMVPQFSVQADKGGRPEFVQTRTGEKVYPDAKGKFADPEMQKQWDSEMQAHQGSLTEEEGKEKRVAAYAADRQAQAFSNQQTAEGRKAAAPHLSEINDAKEQQAQMEQLLSGKMNPASQTAAMFKMIGLEQPSGTHRIMPAEIEGIEHLGGLSDRLKQKLLSWKEGDRFSPDMVPDVLSTAKILSQTKLKTANDNLASNYQNTGYKVPGTDAKGRLDKPEDYADTSAPPAAAASGQANSTATAKVVLGQKVKIKGNELTVTAVHQDGSFDAK